MADSIKIRITGDDSSYRKTLSGLGSAARTAVKGLTVAAAAVSAAWSAVGVVGVRYNAQIEQLQTSFEVMTGSAEKGAEVLERIRQIAAATPFETEGLASTVQLLMNYNLTADEAINSMEMLGDISQGNQDKLSRIAMAYGQMSSAGKVLLEDVKQMTEAGFNPLAEISETTGESMASLYDRISKGTLAVDEITASMVRATSEGGKYFQSMEKQSQTLNGQLSTLKDNAMSLLGDVMTPLTDSIRDELLPMANNLLGEFATAFDQGGFDGLLDAVTGKIPDLLNAALEMGEKVISGIADWLPGAVKQIASVLPNALRSILDVAPQLVSALFDVASSLVSDLITMLPELVPMIVEGIGNLIPAIIDGAVGLIDGIFDGILGIFGIETRSFGEAMNDAFNDYDRENVRELKEVWEATIETEVTVEDYQTEIDAEIAAVKEALKNIPGLEADEEAAILDAIVNGAGLDLLEDVLKDKGIPEEDVNAMASTISSAMATISNAVNGLGLTEDAKQHLAELIAQGASESEITEALKSFGVADGVAEETAGKITSEMGTIDAAVNGLGLSDDAKNHIAQIVAEGGDAEDISDALQAYGIDAGIADETAQTIIDSKGKIDAAVNGIGLSEDAKAHIAQIIAEGGDAEAVSEALQGYGIDAGIADETAKTITESSGKIDSAAKGIGLGPETRSQLAAGSVSDKLLISASLLALGAPQDVIDTVAGSYDSISGSLQGKLTAAINSAYASLTDGETDTPQVMAEIQSEIEDAYSEAVDAINDWIDDEIAKLDPTSEDYEAKVAEIKETGQESINQVEGYQAAMWAILSGLANASVADVDAAWARIEELLQLSNDTIAQFEVLKGRLDEQNDTDVELTKAGVVRESTQEVAARAFAYTMQQNALEKAEIEKYKQEQMEALAAAFEETGDKEAYNAGLDALEAEIESRNAERLRIYATSLQALIDGMIASTEETNPELAEAMRNALKGAELTSLSEEIEAELNASIKKGSFDLSDAMIRAINESAGTAFTREDLEGMNFADVYNYLYDALDDALKELRYVDVPEDLDMGWVGDVLQTALQEGAFNDFSADGINTDDMVEALSDLGEYAGEGLEEGIRESADGATTAAGDMAQGTIDEVASTLETGSPSKAMRRIGEWAGQGLANGLGSKYWTVYNAAKRLAEAAESGARITLRISSPSKVFEELGMFTGEGFLVGYEKSIREAQRTVRGLTGGLISAANFPARNAVTVTQGAVYAADSGDDLSRLNVGLYISDRKIAEATADANSRVSNARTRRMAAGWGHV